MFNRTRTFLVVFLMGVSPGLLAAGGPAVTGASGGTTFISIDDTDQTLGFTFEANADVVVTALGVADTTPGDPLSQTHQVGLWTAGGVLLASATVQTDSTLIGGWRYVYIPPVTLQTGQTYVLGSAVTSPYLDPYNRVPDVGSVSTNPKITIGISATNDSAGGFSFPLNVNASFLARLGPNMLIGASPVPLSPLALAAITTFLALVGLVVIRRRSQA